MILSWHGQSFFEILFKTAQSEKLVLTFDPFEKSEGLSCLKIQADITLFTKISADPDLLIKDEKTGGFSISSPGEYGLKGIFIKAIPSGSENIIYKIEGEGLKICHLGFFNKKELTPEELEEIGSVDVLMVPVGGKVVLGPNEAVGIISQIEPRAVIPMVYKLPKLSANFEEVGKFLKLMGEDNLQPEKKIKISAKDLPNEEEETKIFLLEP